jgi:hypothetical protein
MKNEVKFTCGNYLVTVLLKDVLEVAGMLVGLVLAGVTQILQRKPASKWEKLIAKYDKRPDGFERASIPFTAEGAKELARIMMDAIVTPAVAASEGVEASKEVKISDIATVFVVEYVPEVKLGKFKEEIDLIARHESEDDVEEWLEKKVGFDGVYEDSTTESGYTLEALQAVNAYKRASLKGL